MTRESLVYDVLVMAMIFSGRIRKRRYHLSCERQDRGLKREKLLSMEQK